MLYPLSFFQPPTGYGVDCNNGDPFRLLDPGAYRLDLTAGDTPANYQFTLTAVTTVETAHSGTINTGPMTIDPSEHHLHTVEVADAGQYLLDIEGCTAATFTATQEPSWWSSCGDAPRVITLALGPNALQVRSTGTDTYTLTLTPRATEQGPVTTGSPVTGNVTSEYHVDRWTFTMPTVHNHDQPRQLSCRRLGDAATLHDRRRAG